MKEKDQGSLQVHQLIYLIWTAIVKGMSFYSINFVTKQKFTHNYRTSDWWLYILKAAKAFRIRLAYVHKDHPKPAKPCWISSKN